MRQLTFVVGTGRTGSTALSGLLHAHPDVLSLNEYLASVGSAALADGSLDGRAFWQLLAAPNPTFETMIRSGYPMPEFLYTRRPGRFATATTGIPALSLMVLPHLTDDPDALFDALAAQVTGWPARTATQHHHALFDALCARFARSAVVERSGYSGHRIPRLRAAFPQARFVHLSRNGPDCALSMSRHPGYRLIFLQREILARAGVAHPAELTPDHVRSLPPELSALLADRFDAALVRDRALPTPAFGALWSELVAEAAGLLCEVPAALRTTLTYEDLLDDPRRELTRLAAFVGVDARPGWLEAAARTLDPGRAGASSGLPAAELSALRAQCVRGERVLAGG
ncbi:sulfotransferase [Streptomyces sp. NPDC006733]|uniref:sulfotransferase n=1 Tax=Streptomyces sp. NPDC006733 TaxID=3155460 RepID=UPI0033E5DEBA